MLSTAFFFSDTDLDPVPSLLFSPFRLLMGHFLDYPPGALTGWASLGRLFTTSFLAYGWAPLLGSTLVLCTAGPEAERVLGRTRFALIFLLSAAAKSVAYFADAATFPWFPDIEALEGVTLGETCGPGAGILGLAAAMAVVLLRNRRLLAPEQRSAWGAAAAGSAVVAAASEQQLLDGSYAAALAVGALLGWAAGPRFQAPPASAAGGATPAAPPGAAPPKELASAVDLTSPLRQGASFMLVGGGLLATTVVLELVFLINVEVGLEAMVGALQEEGRLPSGDEQEFWARELERESGRLRDQLPGGLQEPLESLLGRPARQA
jgi:membrane associated rhomboid family serine protease